MLEKCCLYCLKQAVRTKATCTVYYQLLEQMLLVLPLKQFFNYFIRIVKTNHVMDDVCTILLRLIEQIMLSLSV